MLKIFFKYIRWAFALFFSTTLLSVVAYRFLPIYFTPLMFTRCFEQVVEGKKLTLRHTWVSLDKISPHLPVAVMASEDGHFLLHHGFDYNAIQKAAKNNMIEGKRKLGASTISQQTTKNVFLWQGRSWIRKGLEAYFTILIEILWSKQRIMEVYLNSIEMGDGIYGAEAVAKYHFDKKALELSRADCALIAATLPNPIKYNSSKPGSYIQKRQKRIMNEMKYIPSFPLEGEDINIKTVKGGIYKNLK